MPELKIDDVPAAIRAIKAQLRKDLPNYAEVFKQLEANIREQVEDIKKDWAEGRNPVPVVQADDILAGRVTEEQKQKIRKRGSCSVRGVFAVEKAKAWNQEIGEYLEKNNFTERLKNAAEDNYFATLTDGKPQIYGIYWSKPQVQARQDERMNAVQVFMNQLWRTEGRENAFDATRIVSYADRIRRRPPQSNSLGLSPHVDGGSVERWIDENFRHVYRHVFSGEWQKYDPFDSEKRTEVREFPSPAVCSVFRSFQGWTALTPQRKHAGTLMLVPIANAMAYIILRALQDDVPEDELCGAQPRRTLPINQTYHSLLLEALSAIPDMEPGDTIFWHCDMIHAVENEHHGEFDSNVMYIAAVPHCPKNVEYAQRQYKKFVEGKSPPDFAPDDFEVDMDGRATAKDLTELGKTQMNPQ